MVKLDKSFNLRVKASDTIDNVKAKIERKKGIPEDEFWLAFNSKPLEGWPALSVYGIKASTAVYMVDCKITNANLKLMFHFCTKPFHQVLAGLRGGSPKKDIVKKTMLKKKGSAPIEDNDKQLKPKTK